MSKITLRSTVSFTKEFTMDTDDYPGCKTVEDIIAYEKRGTEEEPMCIVDGGDVKVTVEKV